MNSFEKILGNKIREAREEKGLTQKELGQTLGYSPMGISHFEKGIRKLKISDIKKLSEHLGKDLFYFMPNESKPETTFPRIEGEIDFQIQSSLENFNKHIKKLTK